MAKTINEIRDSFYGVYSDNAALGKQEALKVAINATEQTLLEYYKSPTGRKDIDESPHRSLTSEAAVEMLMEDVRSWAKTIREAR